MRTAVKAKRSWGMVLAQLEQDSIAQRASLSRYASGSVDKYRCHITYITTGRTRTTVIDIAALDRICERLVETERAHEILRALGYGKAWNSITELAQMVPHSTTLLVRPKKT